MHLKLLIIGSIYPGYLGSFFNRIGDISSSSYDDHYNKILNDTTEFVGVYTRTFRKLSVDASCIIANDKLLQLKWKTENFGKTVSNINLIFEQIKKEQPEILWIEDINFTNIEFLTRLRKEIKSLKLIFAYHCSPYNQKILDQLKLVDFVLTCTPGLKADFQNRGIQSYLVYHGFDEKLLSRVQENNSKIENNFIFSGSLATGSGYHGARIELIENILRENIDIELFVNLESKYKITAKQILYKTNLFLNNCRMGWLKKHLALLESGNSVVKQYSELLLSKKQTPVFGIDMFQLFNDSKVVLNYHIGVAGNFAGNMRMFEVTGVGSCLLTDNKSNMSDLFDVGSEVVVYENKEDCIAKVKWLLENEDERKKIALAGQKRTLTSHTVENRCNQIIEIINDELKKKRKNG